MTRISAVVDVSSFSTDAKFRTWGLAISTSLAACGLVQTADSGQIDWVTVLKAAGANTKQGYEIWRFDDSLQATAPIFLRLDYGSGFGAASPQMWFQVGTGSDGTGVLTGLQGSSTAAPSASALGTATNAAAAMLFTHTAGFVLAYSDSVVAANIGISPFFFAIDRTRDQSSGAATGEGMYVWYAAYVNNDASKGLGRAFSFAPPAVFTVAPTACMPPGDSVNYGGYLFPVYACIPRPLICTSLVGYMNAEIANYSTFTARPMGITGPTVTYIALSNCGTSSLYGTDSVGGVTNEAAVRTAFRWED